MPVTAIDKDPIALTMTVTSEWPAPPERVWQLWADPRRLERWWGPPTHPATFTAFDLRPGGRVAYFMTGPEGERYPGWWTVLAVEPPSRLEFEDGFADADGNPDLSMPATQSSVTLSALPDGATRMVLESRFPSSEAMAQIIEMGVEEGLRAAMGQIGAVLAEG